MKKLLILILIWMGVFVLLRPIGEFKGEAVGNIVYRRNLVTGIITADNGDKSYAVEIGESGKSIKKIFTLSPDPDLAVGDKARVLYRGGNKEDMILLAPTKIVVVPSIIRRYALIVYSPNTIQLFDMDGILLKSIPCDGWSYAEAGITMDSSGNVYTKEWDLIKKYDSDLNLLVTQPIESGSNLIEGINIGPDGYLYSLEDRASGYAVAKRNPTDLTIVADAVSIPAGIIYSGWVCLDSDGNIYIYNYYTKYIEKYNSAGAKIAEHYTYGAVIPYGGVGIAGNLLYWRQADMYFRYAPLDLSTSTMWDLRPGGMNSSYCLTTVDNFVIFGGWDDDNHGAVAKLDSDRNEIWVKKLDPTSQYSYKAGSYNF